MAFLEICNYDKTFKDGFHVLNDINFTLEKGEVLSIIGSSGSGKTTLLRSLNFLIPVDNGKMMLDGEVLFDSASNEKVTEKTLRDKRLNFGLVFQSFNLFPQYSVIGNIMLAPSLILKEKIKTYKAQLKADKTLSKSERKALLSSFKVAEKAKIETDALELLKTVDLLNKKDAYPCDLSGGQCQRVAIARALAMKPKVLCFDEPTSALDPELTGEVLRVIRSLKGEDRTMIIVTHEMGFAKNVSDKVLFMSDGLIEEFGSAEEIFDNPKSEKLKNFLSSVSNKDGDTTQPVNE
ncbi:MAG: amino acid ABC transporter ATP-binding protein [Clostridiales bacterium]|nr:amino acid ABC transporter ATP-binding protein [Clostridiales bacterium]